MTGYLHPAYAESLSEFGKPWFLPKSGGWILERPIPGFPYRDAMGCYPMFACQDWSQLHEDLHETARDLVSLALVTDPFGNYDASLLQRCFDKVIAYKQHFVADLFRPIEQSVAAHHLRNARKALQQVQVEKCEPPALFIDDWTSLYCNLTSRHGIKGISAFSRAAFETQFRVPGIIAFRAVHQEHTVGMILWYVQDNVGYYHLGAYSDSGYQLRASFALFWTAYEYFAVNDVRWVNLGAGAGVKSGREDGLARFKRGWSTGTRLAYFCGRIFSRAKYCEIVSTKPHSEAAAYFPAYRWGEFR
jgi:GNAT acetyltransferase-like protein